MNAKVCYARITRDAESVANGTDVSRQVAFDAPATDAQHMAVNAWAGTGDL